MWLIGVWKFECFFHDSCVRIRIRQAKEFGSVKQERIRRNTSDDLICAGIDWTSNIIRLRCTLKKEFFKWLCKKNFEYLLSSCPNHKYTSTRNRITLPNKLVSVWSTFLHLIDQMKFVSLTKSNKSRIYQMGNVLALVSLLCFSIHI